MDIVHNIKKASRYLQHVATSTNTRGYGIHSPYVFEFVNTVLYGNLADNHEMFLSEIRKELLSNHEIIELKGHGAGSLKFKGHTRKVRDLVAYSSVNLKYANLLYRMARFVGPVQITELGTSIGYSTAALALGSREAPVYTLEAEPGLTGFAQKWHGDLGLDNIRHINGTFEEVIRSVPISKNGPHMVFFDGDHRYGPTMMWFEYFNDRTDEGVFIFDDINWSVGMRKAWKDISKTKGHTAIDLFFMGIVIKKKDIAPARYKILY